MAVDAGIRARSKKRLVKNIFSVGLIQVANYVFPFLSVQIVSRIIGPDKFGVLNFTSSFVAYFTLLINFGFDLSATRAIAASRNDLEKRNKIFNQVILAKILLFVVSVVLFTGALFTVPQLKAERAVSIFTFLLCFSWVITPNWLYQGMQEMTKVAWFNLTAKTLCSIAILIIVREKKDYIWQPLAFSVAQLLVGFYSFSYALRRYNITLKLEKLRPVLALLWNERTIFFSMVVINLYTTTNVVLLGLLQNPEQVGYYTAAWRFIMIVQTLVAVPLSQALFPFLGSGFSQSREKGLDMVKQLFPIVTLITGGVGVFLWLSAPLVIVAFYGSKFEPSIAVFRILAFVPMIIAWSNLLGIQTMINLKLDKIFFRITFSGAVTSIILNLILVRQFGYLGTASSWLVTEIVMTSIMFIVLSRQGISVLDIKYFTPGHFKKYLKPIILTIKQKINK